MKIIKELPKIPFWSGVALIVTGMILLGMHCLCPGLLPIPASESLIDGFILVAIGLTLIGYSIVVWREPEKKR